MSLKYANELKRIRRKYRRRLEKVTKNLKEKENAELEVINKLIRYRNAEMVLQHSRGVSYALLGRRFDLSLSRAREIVIRAKNDNT